MNRKAFIFSLFLLTAVVISLIAYTHSSFNYNFNKGEMWDGERITAAFDFPVFKSDEEYKANIDEYENDFIPIYSIDTTILNDSVEDIVWHLSQKANLDSIGKEKIKSEVYATLAKGIIGNNEKIPSIIRVTNSGTIATRGGNSLMTRLEAQTILQKMTSYYTTITESDIQQLRSSVVSNIIYNSLLNEEELARGLEEISKTKGFITQGSILVGKGDYIDQETFNILESYRTQFYNQGVNSIFKLSFYGYMLFVMLIMVLSYFSLKSFRADVMNKFKNVLFLLLLYVLSVATMTILTTYTSQNLYIIPFVVVPLYISAFYSSKMAIHQYVYLLMILSILAPQPIEFLSVHFLGGVVAIIIMEASYRRNTIVVACLGALVTYSAVYLFISMMSGNYSSNDYSVLIWFAINVFLVVVMYQFLFVIEKVFNFVTNITLFELCDTNRKLLNELATKAPGTFQHSVQVANLAERAAREIGANALLARTGSLYHDIGKMENPGFFIENGALQDTGHTGLTPLQSAEIIRNHVVDGVTMARKANLPSVVVEFIESHHSDSLIYYFYSKERENNSDVNEDDFRYPGPQPQSKEATICTICDSVEAASRTLGVYNEETISGLIDNIVANQIKSGILDSSKLELKHIKRVKESLVKSLLNIYHSRIVYPERK